MLEVINVKLPLESALEGHEHLALKTVAKELGLSTKDVHSLTLKKRAVDARKKSNVHFTASFLVDVGPKESQVLGKNLKNVRPYNQETYTPKPYTGKAPKGRPVIVGAGCAGLFCALALAESGLEPLVLERGQSSRQRSKDIEHFDHTGELNTESNIQFGLGGAGTFSDGKLTTNTSSPYHQYIINAFVKAGAPESILWKAKPHVGSDYLPKVVEKLVEKIESCGGTVLFGAKFTEFATDKNGQISEVHYLVDGTEHTERTDYLILATGHSARDVFAYLNNQHVFLERKTFSMGVRIEHRQKDVNLAQYGKAAFHPALGAADYKLVAHLKNGRSAYTFCMCPGGTVVAAASEQDRVCTNGMSLYARAGKNANAGLLVNVTPQDLEGSSVLAGIELQRTCESKAFELGGGNYVAPAQRVEDFLAQQPSSCAGKIAPSYPRGVVFTSIEACLPSYITDTMRQALPLMQRRLSCFADPDAVLTGVETRSSSPIRITRAPETCVSISHPGLIPCGEGAGYAGGIMSAAADGIRCAEAYLAQIAHAGE